MRKSAAATSSAKGKSSPESSVNEDDNSLTGMRVNVQTFVPLQATAGWSVKYQIPLRCISIQKISRDSVTLSFHQDHSKSKKAREFTFGSRGDTDAFAEMIRTEKEKDEERVDAKIKAALGDNKDGGDIKVQQNEKLELLIEIVSGWNLPIADITSSDPLVACYFNGEEVHKTNYIPKT